MKRTEIKSIIPYLIGSKFIGMGFTAMCFLMQNGKVIKLYINTYSKYELFSKRENICDHFEIIGSLNNETYVGPEEILLKNGMCIAYIYDYIPGKTLNRISDNTLLLDLLTNYNLVVKSTKQISDKKFILCDMHAKNILFTNNNQLKIIDLDRGYIEKKSSVNEIYNSNIYKINNNLIYSLFDVPILTKNLTFYNSKLHRLYLDALHDPSYMIPFFEKLGSLTEKEPTKKNIKKLDLISSDYNYYIR